MLMLLVLVCLLFGMWCVAYVQKSGLLKKYPEKEYLAEDESAERPLYNQLTDDEKSLYTAVYRGINNFSDVISLPYDASGDEYTKIYCLLEKQESGLFWLDSTFYTAQRLRDAKMVYRTEDAEELKSMKLKFDKAVSKAMSGIAQSMTEYEKALYIHDYIVKNCRYSADDAEGLKATAYGCLVDGQAHCEGYAKAFHHLSTEAGMNCVVVTGVTDDGENHAWNQLEIDGSWYNLDVTWDDTDVEADARHIYFLCDDAEMSKTHIPDENNFFVPFPCVDENGYYMRENLYISDMAEAENAVRQENNAGKTAIELKFSSKNAYDEFRRIYIEGKAIFDILMETRSGILGGSFVITLKENEKALCMTVIIS